MSWLRFTFELADSELHIRIGQRTFRKLPYTDIKEIEMPDGRWVLWHFGVTERWVNFSRQACMLIRRKSTLLGMRKIMVINPPDRDAFVSRLRAKMGDV
jgi:hypothetical protein